jgi:DivIVA domain-containing protein
VKITPLDVDQQQFQRVFRGCDPDEVHRFLDLVSREMEELLRENNGLKEEIRRKEAQISEFREHESQLREALVSAGRMTGRDQGVRAQGGRARRGRGSTEGPEDRPRRAGAQRLAQRRDR